MGSNEVNGWKQYSIRIDEITMNQEVPVVTE